MTEEKGLMISSFSVQSIKDHMDQIHKLMETVMKEDEHYGVIPGTKKKSLYKQGAEKLSMMFRLSPEYKIENIDLGEGHREVRTSVKIIHIPTQTIIAEGVGSCSTMESKFRYRNIAEDTGEEIPKDSKERKAFYKSQGLGMKKINGTWCWVKFQVVENPDIADVYNTVLKMSKKRAHIDGILTATAASDIFTQDYEPGDDDSGNHEPHIDYETDEQAEASLKSCQNLVDLEKACTRYWDDYRAGKTGWSPETWKRISGIMAEVKERIEKGGLVKTEEKQQDQESNASKLASAVKLPENQDKIEYLLREGIVEQSDTETKDENKAAAVLKIINETQMNEPEQSAPYGL
jgi:hypothetical protein